VQTALATQPVHPHPIFTEGKELGAEITELCAYIYAATYQLLTLIREFDEKRYWELPGLMSCAHWLNFKCGIGMNAAREKVRVAHALKDLPKISEAFRKGELSYSKVRAVTRIAKAENEDYLLMIARHGTAFHVEKLVSKYRRCERQQDIENANLVHNRRELTCFYDADGSFVIKGRMPAEQGALIMKALELALEKEYQAPAKAEEDEGSAANDGSHDVSAETSRHETLPARRADALAEIAETYLDADPTSASSADRFQVVVHVSAETSEDNSHIENGPHVSAETSRRIACDCSKIRIGEDEKGEPLSIGRKSRVIPPAIRRAMRARDKGCRFPGCTNTHFVDGHHVKHWANGGETSLDNLVQLCRHHHRLVHEGGFACERQEDGKFVFRDPTGRLLVESWQLASLPNAEEPINWRESYMPDVVIDSETCVSLWTGERIDWDLAVGHLFA